MAVDSSILERFAGLHLVVIGEAMLDRYLHGTTDRLCREAPVPIIAVNDIVEAPGAAANVAANVAGLGARVSLISTVGADIAGQTLVAALETMNADTSAIVRDEQRQTLTKERVVAGSHMLMRLDSGTTDRTGVEAEEQMRESLRRLIPACDAVAVSDYAYGILTPAVRATLAEEIKSAGVPVLVDAKAPRLYRELGPTLLKPNYAEAVRLLGQLEEGSTAAKVHQLTVGAATLLEESGAAMVAVSLDEDGALLLRQDAAPYRVLGHAAPGARGAGAGDCFLAALAVCLAAEASPETAAEIAVRTAAIGVCSDGTALCDREQLRAALGRRPGKLVTLAELLPRLEELRRAGSRIVFTNGCFDIVHRGHTTFLSEARAQGDVLVVGLNSDASVRSLKGPTRPVNAIADRAEVLAALSSVDFVVPFDDLVPFELIRTLRPQIFVKGGDYTPESLPEAELVQQQGGIVRILDYLPEHSTTGVIEKMSRPSLELEPQR